MTATTPTEMPREQTEWLESPGWDFVWLLNGLWLLPLLLVSISLGQGRPFVMWLEGVTMLLLWGGHILSPMLTAWYSPPLRAQMKRSLPRYVVLPAAIIVVSVGCASYGVDSPLALGMVCLFVLWNTYHFAAQHFGVLSIYRIRSGLRETRERTLDRAFCNFMICFLLPAGWYTQSKRLGPLFDFLPLPPESRAPLALPVLALAALATCAILIRECKRERISWPRCAYLATIGAQVILATVSYPLFNFALFSVSHWVIALALSSRILSNLEMRDLDASTAQGDRPGRSRQAWYPAYAVALIGLLALSTPLYALFWSADVGATVHYLTLGVFGRDPNTERALAAQTPWALAVGGLYFGVTFVHFYYDRVLYSFRTTGVQRGVAPYLFVQRR
jgi:hypothetical protein